jgi:hypothetical protein
MPPHLASYTESVLETYYSSFSPPKRVVSSMVFYSTIQSFQLPGEVGDVTLGKDISEDVPPHTPTVKLVPKDLEANSCMLDLGVYMHVLACSTLFGIIIIVINHRL